MNTREIRATTNLIKDLMLQRFIAVTPHLAPPLKYTPTNYVVPFHKQKYEPRNYTILSWQRRSFCQNKISDHKLHERTILVQSKTCYC